VNESSWLHGITREQWLVLGVAWLGWVFDSMDATIYVLVLHPSLAELLPAPSPGVAVPQEVIAWYGGIIFSIFLIGWTIGGITFGLLADRIGRTRTLVITILIYAAFTGLAALSQEWWHLAAYRFLTALGIGGEWAAGAALVAETWPEDKRVKAAGILQSAWGVGFFVAAGLNWALSQYGWRLLFLVGILPAVVAVIVRLFVKESQQWIKARSAVAPDRRGVVMMLWQIVQPPLRRRTVVGSGLAFVAVFGLWGATNWAPTLIRTLPDLQGVSPIRVTESVSVAMMALNVGAILGYLSFGPLADRYGRKPAFALMFTGSLVMLPVTFLTSLDYSEMLIVLPLLGFFNNGIFSGFPIYLPELYPTALRATGAGFCFNAGRVLAAVGPLLTGLLVSTLGHFGRAASAIGLIYMVGLAILLMAPETKGRPLPK
jgi:MFS family permease